MINKNWLNLNHDEKATILYHYGISIKEWSSLDRDEQIKLINKMIGV